MQTIQTQLFEGSRREDTFAQYQKELLQHAHSRIGKIPNPAAEMEAIKWLYKELHPANICIRFFELKLTEMKMSGKSFRISWQLVKSQIGSWLAVSGIHNAEPSPDSISPALAEQISELDSIDKYIERGYASFNSLDISAQDGLVMEKIDSFLSSKWARQYNHFSDEQLTDKAIYEIAKELAR